MAFRLPYAFAGALAAALVLGVGAPLAAQQDTTSSSRSGMSQDTTHKTKTTTTRKHRRTARRHTRRMRSDSLRARTDTSGYRSQPSRRDTSGMMRDTSGMMRMNRDTSSMMRSDSSSMMRSDSTRSMQRDTSGAMRSDTSGYSAGARDTSGVTPNRAGLPGDSSHAHPGAQPLQTQTQQVQTDSMTRRGATTNPPGIQSAPAGDSTQNRGEMTKPTVGGSTTGDTMPKRDSSSSSSSTTNPR